MLKLVMLSTCVVGALSSLLRSDSAWPKVCPIDLAYDAKLEKCVAPEKIKEPTTSPTDIDDYAYLYDELTEKPTRPPPAPIAAFEKPTRPPPAPIAAFEKPTRPPPAPIAAFEKPTRPPPAPVAAFDPDDY